MSLEIFDQVERWRARGDTVAMATVVGTAGSSPRPLGSKMAISSTGEFVGSVSGGCIEGAVIEEASIVLQIGTPKHLEYGITDDQAWQVGLSCGGAIVVFVEPLPERNPRTSSSPSNQVAEHLSPPDWFGKLHNALRTDQDLRSICIVKSEDQRWVGTRALLTPLQDDSDPSSPILYPSHHLEPLTQADSDIYSESLKTLFELGPGAHSCVLPQANDSATSVQTSGQTTTETTTVEVFIEHYQPPPRLVIVGAVHIAEHLVHFASRLDFHCTVIDARSAFATPERFAHADRLVVGWPGDVVENLPLRRTSYCAFLTHDPKLDDPAMLVALRAKARYIGALGSRKTHAKRLQRLAQAGASAKDLQRIDAPIGIHLGGRRPEEIALAIAAQLICVRTGKS